MRVVIFLLIYFLFSKNTLAATYFDFVSDDYLINYDGEITMNLQYNLIGYSEDNFRIRPVCSCGNIFIYSLEKETWVKNNDSWLEMPQLSKKVVLKASSQNPADIHLEIQNIGTSFIYQTSPKKYYPYVYLQKNFKKPVLTIPLQSREKQTPFNKVIKYLNGFLNKT